MKRGYSVSFKILVTTCSPVRTIRSTSKNVTPKHPASSKTAHTTWRFASDEANC
ncbi:MAG: hypothetical protein ACFFDN_37290 [Candidatus Hodarchaeota archaeon]